MTETTNRVYAVGDAVNVADPYDSTAPRKVGRVSKIQDAWSGSTSTDGVKDVKVSFTERPGSFAWTDYDDETGTHPFAYWFRSDSDTIRPELAEWERELLASVESEPTPSESPEVTALKAEVTALTERLTASGERADRAREATQAERERHLTNLRHIGRCLKAEAENREYCSEYEDSIREMTAGMAIFGDVLEEEAVRSTDFEVSWSASGTVTVHAANASEAQELFESDPSNYLSTYDVRDSIEVDDVE